MNSNPTSAISGDLIKHEAFLDVAMFLTCRPHLTPEGIYLNGFWMNLGFNQTFNTGHTFIMTIPFSKIADGKWHKCVDPDWRKENGSQKCSKSYRHSAWEPIIVSDSLVKNV
jgi:hypothetical protein